MKKFIFLSCFVSSLGAANSNVYCPDTVVCLHHQCITYPEADPAFHIGNDAPEDDTYYFWKATASRGGYTICEFKSRTTYILPIRYLSQKLTMDKSITNVWEDVTYEGYFTSECTPNPEGHGNPRFCPFKTKA